LVTSRKWIAGIGILRNCAVCGGLGDPRRGPRVDTLAFLSSVINVD
jgi:hypothetical protein